MSKKITHILQFVCRLIIMNDVMQWPIIAENDHDDGERGRPGVPGGQPKRDQGPAPAPRPPAHQAAYWPGIGHHDDSLTTDTDHCRPPPRPWPTTWWWVQNSRDTVTTQNSDRVHSEMRMSVLFKQPHFIFPYPLGFHVSAQATFKVATHCLMRTNWFP